MWVITADSRRRGRRDRGFDPVGPTGGCPHEATRGRSPPWVTTAHSWPHRARVCESGPYLALNAHSPPAIARVCTYDPRWRDPVTRHHGGDEFRDPTHICA